MKTIVAQLGLTVLGSLTGLVSACGGTTDSERPEKVVWLEPLDDPGSGPFDCSEDDGIEFRVVENWETGAGTGWFSNNEFCQPCQDIQDAFDAVSRPLNCLIGESTACTAEENRSILHDALPTENIDSENVDTFVEVLTACFGPSGDEDACSEENSTRVLETAAADSEGNFDEGLRDELIEQFAPTLEYVEEQRALQESLNEQYGECRVTCDPTQTPAALGKPLPAERIEGGDRCGSRYAMHLRNHVSFFRQGTLGLQFSPSEPFDASEYEGVAFWFRHVPGSRNTFRIDVPETHTEEKSVIDGEPVCFFITPKEDTRRQCDKFGRFYLSSPDWKFYMIPFSEMRQAGFGKQAPFFDSEHIFGLSLEYKQGVWDFWLDDIGFYKRK